MCYLDFRYLLVFIVRLVHNNILRVPTAVTEFPSVFDQSDRSASVESDLHPELQLFPLQFQLGYNNIQIFDGIYARPLDNHVLNRFGNVDLAVQFIVFEDFHVSLVVADV